MYEQAARVPLIVSWPDRWPGGQRRTGACSLVDLVQTIADLGGGRCPGDLDGDSLTPWLDDADHAWKDMAVSEYYGHNICSGYAMLRTGRWKYVYHTPPDGWHSPEHELYDMAADPMEFSDLAGDAAHADRVWSMHEALVQELGEHPDEAEQRCRFDYSQGYDR
jgi:choline-sulfatase